MAHFFMVHLVLSVVGVRACSPSPSLENCCRLIGGLHAHPDMPRTKFGSGVLSITERDWFATATRTSKGLSSSYTPPAETTRHAIRQRRRMRTLPLGL